MNSNRDLAESFMTATVEKDLAGMGELFHEDATFWTNITQSDKDKTTRFKRIAEEFRIFEEFAWGATKIDVFDNGFVIRTVTMGMLPNKERFEFPLCIIAETRGERIERFEEYLNAGPVAPILGVLDQPSSS